ncbi:MAG: sugar ABC transporter substrate-binding protein [Alphaproteobacteria bacterium]|nr:sugar ABC transporter substrate-binding protein [Alphaproteobacteria bacterium]
MKNLTTFAVAIATAALVGSVPAVSQTKIGIVAYQMSAETHARVANAAEAAAKAKGWQATVLNSRGSTPEHAAQVENLIQSGVNGIVMAMGKMLELDAQLAQAKAKGIPVISVMSGASPHAQYDVNVDEFVVGAKIATYLLARMNYQGNLLMQRYEGHGGTRARGKVMDVVLTENSGVKLLGSYTMARPQTWREDVKAGMEALILKNQGSINAIWASFDGQAFIIDDLLKAAGAKKGQVLLTGVDGGQETFNRIRDKDSLVIATVAIPFEKMGEAAIDGIDRIAVKKQAKATITPGPFLYMDPVLVDETNVPAAGKWPW